MLEMHNPPHPGLLVREWLGTMPVAQAAAKLHISRDTLSRILHGKTAVSAEMAIRLAAATGMRPKLWLDLQAQYDLWQASQKSRPLIEPFERVA